MAEKLNQILYHKAGSKVSCLMSSHAVCHKKQILQRANGFG